MTSVYRKVKVERTRKRILPSGEDPYMGANYRVSVSSATGGGTGGVFSGAATPEGNQTAPVGSVYNQIVGGVFTAQFIKATGSGNTGWQ